MFHKLKAEKRTYLLLVIAFLLGGLFISIPWLLQLKDAHSLINYRNFEINNLNDQIQSLRTDYQNTANPTPSPASLPYVKKEVLSIVNTYSLDCYSSQQKEGAQWLSILKNKLDSEESIINYCYNNDLNSILFLIGKELGGGGMGSPGTTEFKLGILSIPLNEVSILRTSGGNYLWGYCGQLIAWTKTNNVYYSCGGGDGPWGSKTIYQVNIPSGSIGITESCFEQEGKPKSCTTYPDYQFCKDKSLL